MKILLINPNISASVSELIASEARRAASPATQIEVLHHPEWVEGRVKKMRGTPGLRGVGKPSEVIVAGKAVKRSPLAWWAAWQLSGDWR